MYVLWKAGQRKQGSRPRYGRGKARMRERNVVRLPVFEVPQSYQRYHCRREERNYNALTYERLPPRRHQGVGTGAKKYRVHEVRHDQRKNLVSSAYRENASKAVPRGVKRGAQACCAGQRSPRSDSVSGLRSQEGLQFGRQALLHVVNDLQQRFRGSRRRSRVVSYSPVTNDARRLSSEYSSQNEKGARVAHLERYFRDRCHSPLTKSELKRCAQQFSIVFRQAANARRLAGREKACLAAVG